MPVSSILSYLILHSNQLYIVNLVYFQGPIPSRARSARNASHVLPRGAKVQKNQGCIPSIYPKGKPFAMKSATGHREGSRAKTNGYYTGRGWLAPCFPS